MGKLIVILVFVGIGIIRKLAEDAAKRRQKQAADEVANMPKDQRAKVQSEIEAFLQGVTGKKKKPQQNRPRRQPRSQQRNQEARAQRQEQARREAAERAQKERARPISSVSDHVDQYIGQHVDQHIGHGVEENVPIEIVDDPKTLINEAAVPPPEAPDDTTASELSDLLRSPEGMRQAMIASEILSRPRALRK